VLGGRGEQAQAVRDGRADVALLSAFDDRGLDFEPLIAEPRLAALAAADPLAGRPCLRLADLAGRVFRWNPRQPRRDGRPAPRRRPGDREPHPAGESTPVAAASHTISDLTQIFSLIELGSIVCFLPASWPGATAAEIAYRPVSDLQPATLAVAWPESSRSATVAAFVRTATATAAAQQKQKA